MSYNLEFLDLMNMTSAQNFDQWLSHVEIMKDMAKRSKNPDVKAFSLRLAARYYYKSGEIELAQKLIKEALSLYPLNHRYHQHTLNELTRYKNETILKI